jgi:hypothetical protein
MSPSPKRPPNPYFEIVAKYGLALHQLYQDVSGDRESPLPGEVETIISQACAQAVQAHKKSLPTSDQKIRQDCFRKLCEIMQREGCNSPEELADKWKECHEVIQEALNQAQESTDFWKDVIQSAMEEDGITAAEAVRRELHDFHFIMEQYPLVLCHVTGGKLSKLTYEASVINAAADEYVQDIVDEAVAEDREVRHCAPSDDS